jgi:hypothetical protein
MQTDKKIIFIKEDSKEVWKTLLEKIFPIEDYHLIWDDSDILGDSPKLNISQLDLILCDYFLKENGKLIKGDCWLKENILSRDSEIPVVFWTSSMDPAVIKRTIIGSEVFFKKKLDINEFKETIDRLIDRRRLNKSYPLYNSFFSQKITDPDKRNVLFNIYLNASRLLESFFAQSKFHTVFNAHGLIHVQRVIDNLSLLMKFCIADKSDYFSEEDYMCVYLAALIHDLGMVPDIYEENIEFIKFKEIRNNHCLRIFDWVYSVTILKKLKIDNKVIQIYKQFNINEKVALIVLYHDSHYTFSNFPESCAEDLKNKFKITDINFLDKCKDDYKLKTLAGLLALADKMDYGISRVPVDPIRQSNLRSKRDEFEYIKNELIDNFKMEIDNNENKIIVNIEATKLPIVDSEANYFAQFEAELKKSAGVINDNIKSFIVSDLIKDLYHKTWINIKDAFNSCGNNFLSKLIFLVEGTNKSKEYNISLPDDNSKIVGIDALNWEEKASINYFFNSTNYNSIRLEEIAEGFSGDKAFFVRDIKVKTYDSQSSFYSGQDKFLKIGKYDRIHKEVNNYKKISVTYLHPKSTIGQIEEFKYLDYGGYIGSIIKDDNDIVVSLEKFVKGNSAQLYDCIDQALSTFFKQIKSVEEQTFKNIYNFYKNLAESKKSKKPTNERLNKQNEFIDDFLKLLAQINRGNWPEVKFHSGIIHGDFTFRNILKSSQNLVFIDFAESGWGHYFFDYAKLDNYLRFEFLDKYEENYIDLEKKILCNDRVKNAYDSVHSTIWKFCQAAAKVYDKSFIIQKYLALLFMNIWSIPYKDGTINTSFDQRMELVNFYFDEIKDLLKL